MLTLGLFALTYLGLMYTRIPYFGFSRTTTVLIGAIGISLLEFSTAAALQSIDLPVIALLFSVLLLARGLTDCGLFSRWCAWLSKMNASPRTLLWQLSVATALCSALLLNDTACLLFAPFALQLAKSRGISPKPFLFAIALSANIGGVATLSGNPQNMIIAVEHANTLRFVDYVKIGIPVSLGSLALSTLLIARIFRNELQTAQRHPLASPTDSAPFNGRLAVACLLGLTFFLVAAVAGFSLPGASLLAVACMFLLGGQPATECIKKIDWPLLVFFAALFVVVSGVMHSSVFTHLFSVFTKNVTSSMNMLIATTLIGSNLFSNVPCVALLAPLTSTMDQPAHAAITLAVISTLSGNLTLFGSIANLIVFNHDAREASVSWSEYAKIGFVVTTSTLVVAIVILKVLL